MTPKVFRDRKLGGELPSWYNEFDLSGVSDFTGGRKLVSTRAHLTKRERERFIRFRKLLRKMANETAETRRYQLRDEFEARLSRLTRKQRK